LSFNVYKVLRYTRALVFLRLKLFPHLRLPRSDLCSLFDSTRFKMSPKNIFSNETFSTAVTIVGLFLGVSISVALVVGLVSKAFPAEFTRV